MENKLCSQLQFLLVDKTFSSGENVKSVTFSVGEKKKE